MYKMDEQLKMLGKKILENEKTIVLLPEKVQEVRDAKNIVAQAISGNSVIITYEIGEIFKSTGSVSISGKEILVTNPTLFAKAAAMSSVFEIYSKTDGTVQMDFTFNGLTGKEAC